MHDVPMMQLQSGPVQFTKEGTGTLFYLLTLKYGLAGIFHDAADRGFSIERHYSQKDFKAGDLIKVTLRLRNTKERRFVAVTDPIPAGTEPVDSAFATTATELASPRFKSARLLPPQQRGAPGEVMFKLHPPLKLPESPTESSSTYKLQVPLGFVPLKIERLVP